MRTYIFSALAHFGIVIFVANGRLLGEYPLLFLISGLCVIGLSLNNTWIFGEHNNLSKNN